MKEILNKVTKLLEDDGIYADVYQYEDLPAIVVHIEWGDQKHEHLRAQWLLETMKELKYWGSETTETDGSDCYSAEHLYIVVA